MAATLSENDTDRTQATALATAQLSAPQIQQRVAIAAAEGNAIPACRDLARRHGKCPSAIMRWILEGLPIPGGGRVMLPTVKVGRTHFTTNEAVAWFFLRSSDANATQGEKAATPSFRTPAQRKRETATARKRLRDRHGI
jgi:hypothetical protein